MGLVIAHTFRPLFSGLGEFDSLTYPRSHLNVKNLLPHRQRVVSLPKIDIDNKARLRYQIGYWFRLIDASICGAALSRHSSKSEIGSRSRYTFRHFRFTRFEKAMSYLYLPLRKNFTTKSTKNTNLYKFYLNIENLILYARSDS